MWRTTAREVISSSELMQSIILFTINHLQNHASHVCHFFFFSKESCQNTFELVLYHQFHFHFKMMVESVSKLYMLKLSQLNIHVILVMDFWCINTLKFHCSVCMYILFWIPTMNEISLTDWLFSVCPVFWTFPRDLNRFCFCSV